MYFLFGGETLGGYISRFAFRGIFGVGYTNTFGAIITFLFCLLIAVLAVIGLFHVIKWIIWGLPTKKK